MWNVADLCRGSGWSVFVPRGKRKTVIKTKGGVTFVEFTEVPEEKKRVLWLAKFLQRLLKVRVACSTAAAESVLYT